MAVEDAAIALRERRIASRASYAFTIFLGAFLLFQIQPLMGKFIIPWYGGNPSAWTACLIFFQGGLLAGYLYAHLVVRHLAPRTQGIVHTLLLVACLVLLPIAPGGAWKPAPGSQSMAGIFWLLGANVGLPYLLLASTGPITQAWFYRSFPDGGAAQRAAGDLRRSAGDGPVGSFTSRGAVDRRLRERARDVALTRRARAQCGAVPQSCSSTWSRPHPLR